MRSMYQCEKCGKMFENYTDASNCENSHIEVSILEQYQLMDYNDMPAVYAPGEKLPEYVYVKYTLRDSDGNRITRGDYDNDKRGVWMYQRVKATKQQLEDFAKLADSTERKDDKDSLEMKEWREKREREKAEKAEKAEKEQQQSAE